MPAAPKPRDLPESQRVRLESIRDQMLLDARQAFREYAADLRGPADALWQQVWDNRSNPARVRSAVGRFYQGTSARLYDVVTSQVLDAALYAERYDETLRAYKVGQRHPLRDVPGPGEVKAISDYDAYYSLNYGQPGADAAAAYAMRQARTAEEREKLQRELERTKRQRVGPAGREAKQRLTELDRVATAPQTEGDRLAKKHLMPFDDELPLSERLHGRAVSDSREASRVMLRAIRETETTSRAARDLQRLLKDEGQKFARNDRTPKLMRELSEAGARLAELPGDEGTRRNWARVMGKLDGYQRTLKAGGTVQNGYVELLQQLRDPDFNAAQLHKTVEHWSYWKQRYRAEAFISTEQATAYRLAQMERDKKSTWVTGYRWVMGGKLHGTWLKRAPGKLKALGGKHCICEALNGEILSKEMAQHYPRGGHPHCRCTLEPVVDEAAMMAAPTTAEEEAWFQENYPELSGTPGTGGAPPESAPGGRPPVPPTPERRLAQRVHDLERQAEAINVGKVGSYGRWYRHEQHPARLDDMAAHAAAASRLLEAEFYDRWPSESAVRMARAHKIATGDPAITREHVAQGLLLQDLHREVIVNLGPMPRTRLTSCIDTSDVLRPVRHIDGRGNLRAVEEARVGVPTREVRRLIDTGLDLVPRLISKAFRPSGRATLAVSDDIVSVTTSNLTEIAVRLNPMNEFIGRLAHELTHFVSKTSALAGKPPPLTFRDHSEAELAAEAFILSRAQRELGTTEKRIFAWLNHQEDYRPSDVDEAAMRANIHYPAMTTMRGSRTGVEFVPYGVGLLAAGPGRLGYMWSRGNADVIGALLSILGGLPWR